MTTERLTRLAILEAQVQFLALTLLPPFVPLHVCTLGRRRCSAGAGVGAYLDDVELDVFRCLVRFASLLLHSYWS